MYFCIRKFGVEHKASHIPLKIEITLKLFGVVFFVVKNEII